MALWGGVLQRLDRRELTGVLAHEISHIKNGDTRVMTLADLFRRLTLAWSTLGQILFLLMLPIMYLNEATLSWIAFGILLAAPSVSVLLQLALSRTREFQADLDAATLTGDPQGLASALRKIEQPKRSLWNRILFPVGAPGNSDWLRTHPNTGERIKRLLELTKAPEIVSPAYPMMRPAYPMGRAKILPRHGRLYDSPLTRRMLYRFNGGMM
ncbi:MAG: M48 family metalloprotease [Magnetococcales bacterium]|nr:M48 family metalloprotease [Magnetococcales bacterium]